MTYFGELLHLTPTPAVCQGVLNTCQGPRDVLVESSGVLEDHSGLDVLFWLFLENTICHKGLQMPLMSQEKNYSYLEFCTLPTYQSRV